VQGAAVKGGDSRPSLINIGKKWDNESYPAIQRDTGDPGKVARTAAKAAK